ncbi:MAG: DUF6171 family protein [Lachnospiraceae bacterium]|nr:DUF6171 family protein [Lachnospiraceae bacterium]
MTERKPCRKCLLEEYDEARYQELIRREIDWMDAEMRAPEELYRKRLAICTECEKLLQGTCQSCGCYVELRAAAVKGNCPRKKW